MNFVLWMASDRQSPLCYPHVQNDVFEFGDGVSAGDVAGDSGGGICDEFIDVKSVKTQTKTTCPEAGLTHRQVCE